MTQDGWLARYIEVKAFTEENHRNPSKYALEEKLMVHFLKRGGEFMKAGEMKVAMLVMFKDLLTLTEENKRKNQYQ